MRQALEYQEALRRDLVSYVKALCVEARIREEYKNEDCQRNGERHSGRGNGNNVDDASRQNGKGTAKPDIPVRNRMNGRPDADARMARGARAVKTC